MRKLTVILFAAFLNVALFSCTPQALLDDSVLLEDCCGEEAHIPPPPPPTTKND